MMVFLDTEFTDLNILPRLLSVGLVTGSIDGPEFYAEVTDEDRLSATSWFGRGVVLPQFGAVPGAACPYTDLGHRLGLFFDGLAQQLEPGKSIELAHGYHLDWELVDQAITEAATTSWCRTRSRVHALNVYAITGFDEGQLASEAYFADQASAALSRHHALCDARALRVAYEAAQRAAASRRRHHGSQRPAHTSHAPG
jgi:hypothetical protein